MMTPHHVYDSDDSLQNLNWLFVLMKVKYREEFERNKGSSQMEFGETEAYRVSKEAQKMQSEVKNTIFNNVTQIRAFSSQ